MESISKAEIVKRIIEHVDMELMDEEIIHLVLENGYPKKSDPRPVKNRPWDNVPQTALLNLVLSCVAAIQAPLILMSQNRQEEKDRLRAENDYKVNLKSEIIMQDIHAKLDLIIERQDLLMLSQMGDSYPEASSDAGKKKSPPKKT